LKAESFCYWCQGHFEIGGPGVTKLTSQQIVTIKVHLKLVNAHDPNTTIEFIKWLPEAINVLVDGNGAISGAELDLVKKRLASVFTHVIDPSHGPQEHQNLLNDIHKESQPSNSLGWLTDGDSTYRC